MLDKVLNDQEVTTDIPMGNDFEYIRKVTKTKIVQKREHTKHVHKGNFEYGRDAAFALILDRRQLKMPILVRLNN